MNISLLHICPSFNNPLYSQLTDRQLTNGTKLRVFYFRCKGAGLPNSNRPYVDGCMPFSYVDRFIFKLKEYKVRKKFFSLYKQSQFDLIHAHTLFTSGYIAFQAKKKWGIPYVVAVRNSDINAFFYKRPWLRYIGLNILKDADKIVFISKTLKTNLMNKYVKKSDYKFIEDKSIIIPNGIDEFWLRNVPKLKYIGRKSNEAICLIYYGDINKNKNIITTIIAADSLVADGYNIRFYVAGKLSDNRITYEIKKRDYIHYLGFLSKESLIKYLRESDIFVMPSFSETFGLSYVEAMSQGVPIIYTKGQGFDEQFPEGVVGFHVNPKSSVDIANKIKNIMSMQTSMSYNCVKNAQNYNWDNIVYKYDELYKEILEKHSKLL